MKQKRQFLNHFHIRNLWPALLCMLAASILYNYLYLGISFMNPSPAFVYGAQGALSLFFSLVFYRLCVLVWKKGKMKWSGAVVLRVLLWQAVCILFVSGICVPLNTAVQNTAAGQILSQIVSIAGVLFIIPLQLMYNYALFSGKRKGKEIFLYIKDIFKKNYKGILNGFCALLLLLAGVDTLIHGVFTIGSGLNATAFLTGLMYAGNPMVNWMMMVFASEMAGLAAEQVLIPVLFCLAAGCVEAWLELNYIFYIQEACTDYGTVSAKNHR